MHNGIEYEMVFNHDFPTKDLLFDERIEVPGHACQGKRQLLMSGLPDNVFGKLTFRKKGLHIMKDTRQVVTEYMAAMCKPDFEAAFAMFAPDGKYTIIGSSPLSRTFHGIDEINKELCGLLATGFKSIPVIVTEAIIIDGDRGVALAHGSADGKYGKYQQDHYAFVFRVKDGKVIEKIEFLDPSQLDIAVFGRKWAEPVAA